MKHGIKLRALAIAQAATKRIMKAHGDQKPPLILGKVFNDVYEQKILPQLMRSIPVIEILTQAGFSHFVGSPVGQGFIIFVEDESPECFALLEASAGKSLGGGTLIYPCGLPKYEEQLQIVSDYKAVLSEKNVTSEMVSISHKKRGVKEGTITLFIPYV